MEEEKIKKLFLFFLILFSAFGSIHFVQGQDIITYESPVVEVLDLDVDGSTAVFVNITKDFAYIKRVIWNLAFSTNAFETGKFSDDTALTNGVNVYYNDISLLDNDNITNNAKFSHTSYDINIITSDKNPKERLLVSRWSFFKFTSEGLLINDERTLAFHIQDNISALASVDVFQVTVEGTKFTQEQIFNPDQPRNDPLDVLGLFWRDNALTLEGMLIGALGLVIVIVFWRRRS